MVQIMVVMRYLVFNLEKKRKNRNNLGKKIVKMEQMSGQLLISDEIKRFKMKQPAFWPITKQNPDCKTLERAI